MATTDVISGLTSLIIAINSVRTNPDGKDRYKVSDGQSWENTESVGDSTAYKLFAVFREQITVTTTDTVLSFADSVDPMGGIGSNVPSSDPEGGRLKVLAIVNTAPIGGQSVALEANSAGINPISGGVITAYAAGTGFAPNDSGINIQPGGMFVWTSPAGTIAMNDTADDEMRIKTYSGTAVVDILYAVG